MNEFTYHVKLIVQEIDICGYTTYVFENLDLREYIMCVKFPNWDSADINNGETGYLKIREVIEGVDKWYDGEDFIPYKYTNVIFLKFISDKVVIDKSNIILD